MTLSTFVLNSLMGARVFTNTPMPALALSCGVGAGNKPAQADRTAIATIADRTFFVVIAVLLVAGN
jgi:hypothetical protein